VWAALTLAVLTLPVVVVATEEAIRAVPREMREKYTLSDGSTIDGKATYARFRRYQVTVAETVTETEMKGEERRPAGSQRRGARRRPRRRSPAPPRRDGGSPRGRGPSGQR